MKRYLYALTLFVMVVFCNMVVNAEGYGLASVDGTKSVYIGDEVTYNIVISNLQNYDTGITGLQGVITFDPNYYSYVSSTKMQLPIDVQENNTALGEYRIAGFALDNGFNTQKVVYTITLKALKEGNTSINLSEFYLSDLSANLITCKISNLSSEIKVPNKETIKSSELLNIKKENTSSVQKNSENIIFKNELESLKTNILLNLNNENSTKTEYNNQIIDSKINLNQIFSDFIGVITNLFDI